MIQELLLLALTIISIIIILLKDLMKSLIALSLSSLLIVILLFLFKAPDVAITMAVVGTGATTILYLTIIKKIGTKT
jgi:energy-converting hydrogenase B subunit D